MGIPSASTATFPYALAVHSASVTVSSAAPVTLLTGTTTAIRFLIQTAFQTQGATEGDTQYVALDVNGVNVSNRTFSGNSFGSTNTEMVLIGNDTLTATVTGGPKSMGSQMLYYDFPYNLGYQHLRTTLLNQQWTTIIPAGTARLRLPVKVPGLLGDFAVGGCISTTDLVGASVLYRISNGVDHYPYIETTAVSPTDRDRANLLPLNMLLPAGFRLEAYLDDPSAVYTTDTIWSDIG